MSLNKDDVTKTVIMKIGDKMISIEERYVEEILHEVSYKKLGYHIKITDESTGSTLSFDLNRDEISCLQEICWIFTGHA